MKNQDLFKETISRMADVELISAYQQRAEYQTGFVTTAAEELAIRGYDPELLDQKPADEWVIGKKTTDELVEIYTNSFDYSKTWGNLAKNELVARNFDIASLYAEKSNNKKILLSGQSGRYIALGYVLCFLGTWPGLIMGIVYATSKVTTISGERIYCYNLRTRIHGKRMIILALVMAVLFIWAKIH